MQLAIAMITAQRQPATAQASVNSLRAAFGIDIPLTVFAEPGSGYGLTDCRVVARPDVCVHDAMPQSPEGQFNNFGNYIQAARDVMELYPYADTILMCEDDIQITPGIYRFIADRLWPSSQCGVISLYCNGMGHYRHPPGLGKTGVVYAEPLTAQRNLVGALALLFPRHVLHEIVYDQPSIDAWRGSHAQRRTGCEPWERKAVDTWVGRCILEHRYEVWNFNPSLVMHTGVKSSMGHSGRQVTRQAVKWISTPEELSVFG